MLSVAWKWPKSLKLSRPLLFGLVVAICIAANLTSGPWLRNQSSITSDTVRYNPPAASITSGSLANDNSGARETKHDPCLPVYKGPNSLPANLRRDQICTRACDAICCAKVSTSKHRVVPAQFPRVHGKRYMSVYAVNDGISWTIPRFGAWDGTKTLLLLDELRRLGPDSVLLDIGANIGWFSLAAAYAGYRVIAGKIVEFNPFRR